MFLVGNRLRGSTLKLVPTIRASSSITADHSRLRGKPLSQLKEVPEHLERMDETLLSSNVFSKFSKDLEEMGKSDVVVVGSGLSGLACVYQILRSVTRKCSPPVKVAVLEKDSAIGGGHGTTGGLIPYTIVRKPAQKLLDECGMQGIYDDHGKFVTIESSTLRGCMIAKITHIASTHKGITLKFFPGVDVVDGKLCDT